MSHSVRGALVQAFAHHFTKDELELLVYDFYGKDLEQIVDLSAGREIIVQRLLRYAGREGTLPELLEAAAAARPNERDFGRLIDSFLAEERPKYDKYKHLRAELQEILMTFDISPDLLLNAYRMFVPPSWVYAIDETRLKQRAHVRNAVIENLTRILDGLPLLHVVMYLADNTLPEQGTRFNHWIESATNNTDAYKNVNVAEARQFVVRKAREYRERRLHLLVVVHPPDEGEVHYTVTAWRQFVNTVTDQAEAMVKVSYADGLLRSDLREVITRLVARMETERGLLREELKTATGAPAELQHRMVVELFLPLDLFVEEPDQWPVTIHPQPEFTLGKRHGVVLRSWARSYAPEMELVLTSWQRYWSLHGGAAPRPAQLFDQAVFTSSEYNNLVDAKESCCVVISFPLAAKDFGPGGVMDTIVMSGTPVCLWRRVEESRSFLDFSKRILPHTLGDWRQLISQERREALKGKSHHGHHMALLWDDARDERIPPDALAKAPLFPPEA